MNNQDYEKTKIAIRYWLYGAKYFNAVKAMDLGLSVHVGLRRGGTPEFSHQIAQLNYARTLDPYFMYPEETYTTICLHDIVEDYNYSLVTIKNDYGSKVAHSVGLMTKKRNYDLIEYHYEISKDPIASLDKGFDRGHNHQSMLGVFSSEKMQAYIAETKAYILPGIKASRKLFPSQEPAYQNIASVLKMQIEWAENVLQGERR